MRKRDYTIPVKLDYKLKDNDDVFSNPFAESFCILRKKQVLSGSLSPTVNTNKMQLQISSLRPTKGSTYSYWTLLSILLVAFVVAKDCLCDIHSDVKPKFTLESTKYPISPQSSLTSSGKTSHKETLLSSLSEQIERNHFKINPFSHQRPSKFDDGEQLLRNVINLTPQTVHITEQRQQQFSSLPVKKADDGMRHILMMHDHAVGANLKTPLVSPGPQVIQDSGEPVINKWPIRVLSDAIKPTKVLSHVLSYITPLVGSKLSSQATKQLDPASSSHTNEYSLFKGDSPRSFVTPRPRVSFLVRPGRGQQQVTQSSFEVQSPNSISESSDHSNQAKDLMAVESSGVSKSVTPDKKDSSSSSSSSVKDKIKAAQPTSSQEKTQKTNSWLRSNTEKVAQNYLRDSLRALLTLTQLPILQASQISTAPSVLERGSKLRPTNKTNQTSPSSTDQKFKAIEELYRYAYILGTGVRRKRDPLMALGSGPKPDSIKPSRKFSQRSLLGIRHSGSAGSGDGQNQLAHESALKRLLTFTRSKNANPRGVIWDMATDPSLAVTVFHLLERASVALPLGRYLYYLLL